MTMYAPPLSGGKAKKGPELTSSVEDFPASRSLLQDSNKASTTSDGCGQTWHESYATWDRDTSSWKTLQLSFEIPSLSDGCSVTFTNSGSMRNGQLSQRAPWVPHTDVAACTSWRTPVARDYKGYTKREGESICNQLRRIYGGSGRPNPTWLAWLMGFPVEWCEIPSKPSETLSSPRSQSTSAG
ncbi:hypothetical protein PBI_BIPOLAR_69 [Mycobacterium phage Bipolar]|uniref:DNA methyltransferase n=1 Tax=Mycobacterium phage Bipolar TaxID=1551711 RepID=UPI00051A9D7B|nr:DNA methyltransferase [Mycobacterium phage Bipolar]AIT13107.1 hypothetical protein PBI_BIPOLAR_69 [Mycobacterium phage Bipolar]